MQSLMLILFLFCGMLRKCWRQKNIRGSDFNIPSMARERGYMSLIAIVVFVGVDGYNLAYDSESMWSRES